MEIGGQAGGSLDAPNFTNTDEELDQFLREGSIGSAKLALFGVTGYLVTLEPDRRGASPPGGLGTLRIHTHTDRQRRRQTNRPLNQRSVVRAAKPFGVLDRGGPQTQCQTVDDRDTGLMAHRLTNGWFGRHGSV